MAQTIVNIDKTVRGFGSSGYSGLLKQFSGSPILGDTTTVDPGANDNSIKASMKMHLMTDNAVTSIFLDGVLRGRVKDSNVYWGFGPQNFSLDYTGPNVDLQTPNYLFKAKWGSQYVPGTPVNSFVPNTIAPPSPALDPENQPSPPKVMRDWANGDAGFIDRRGHAPFVGPGTNLSPKQASLDVIQKTTALFETKATI